MGLPGVITPINGVITLLISGMGPTLQLPKEMEILGNICWGNRALRRYSKLKKPAHEKIRIGLLGQWLTGFKLLGIPYLVGKISRSNFFFRVHWLSELEDTPGT